MTKIDVVNETTAASGLSPEEVQQAVAAFQEQIHQDFAPLWGIDAMIRQAGREDVHPEHDIIALLDDADQAYALGYHDETQNGRALGKVFVATSKKAGVHWTVTFSHEGLEMLANPLINLTILDALAGRAYAYENCDAVEGDHFAYERQGVLLSDFVKPRYFDQTQSGGTFDYMDYCFLPCPEVLRDGYLAYYDLRAGQWMQQMARPGTSRGERRRKGRAEFRRSTAV